mmetsp:Transcript_59692/g.163651  ORF Transcript_59692/g.163651 Transcript_59692/m.163651 type:complete len:200 (+) Transcript_59692:154-753(+)
MHMFGVRAAAHGSRTRVSSHPSGSAARLSPERRLAARAQRGQQCADRRPNSAKRGRRVAHAISPSRAHLSPTRDGRLVALPALVERLVHLHQQAVEEGLAPQLPRVDGASEGREDAAQLKRHVEGEVAEGEPADAPRRRDEAAREQRRRLASEWHEAITQRGRRAERCDIDSIDADGAHAARRGPVQDRCARLAPLIEV